MHMKCASPEAGLGANDEAPAVLVEVSELELWARLVVVRGDIHDDELDSNYLVKHWLWLHYNFLHCLLSLLLYFLLTCSQGC